uniref:Sugar transferase n=1 Tax=Dictyoglomus thermophilum TaxID=14 RepID=A0A7C3MP28_DICTH
MEKERREALFLLILVILDLITLSFSLPLAYFVRFNLLSKIPYFYVERNEIPQFFPYYFTLNLILFVAWVLLLIIYKVYRSKNFLSFQQVFSAITIGTFLVSSLSFFYRDFFYSRLVFILTWGVAIILTFFTRIILFLLKMSTIGKISNKVIIVGRNEISEVIKSFWEQNPYLNYNVIDVIEDIGNIEELVSQKGINEILVAKRLNNGEILRLVSLKRKKGVYIKMVPESYLFFSKRISFDEISGIPIMELEISNLEGFQGYIKEIIDIVLGTIGLIVFSPLFIIIAILIKLDSEGPIFYKHLRVGRYGKPFYLWKFRTMYKEADKILDKYPELKKEFEKEFKLKKDPRITRIGKFLRKFSLDEIPQIFNILKGEMSIVGPRPVTFKELEKYGEYKDEVLRVKPGLTGLWQVSGRSNLGYARRIALDLYYIQNWSLLLDIKIILKTIPAVFLGKGAY